MTVNGKRGVFITFDGPSGVGKTTLCQQLAEHLTLVGCPVLVTGTPSSSTIGQIARHGTYEFHGPALTCLVAADRYDHIDRTVRPALQQGMAVICDRYIASSLVLDQIDGPGLEFAWSIYSKITIPDLAYILLDDAASCASRAIRRGRYSRFHPRTEVDSRREVDLYRDAYGFLLQHGYPVRAHAVNENSALEIFTELSAEILGSTEGPQP